MKIKVLPKPGKWNPVIGDASQNLYICSICYATERFEDSMKPPFCCWCGHPMENSNIPPFPERIKRKGFPPLPKKFVDGWD